MASASFTTGSTDTEAVSQLAITIEQIYIERVAVLVAFAILYYDYLLTLNDEIECFWGQRPSLPTVLFFVNRYVPLVGVVPVALQEGLARLSVEVCVCSALQKYHQLFLVVGQTVVGTIMIIRTFALFNRSVKVAVALILLALTSDAVGLWAVTLPVPDGETSFDPSFLRGCHPLMSNEDGMHMAVAWTTLLVFDSVIFSLTLSKAIRLWKIGACGLIQVILRDGTLYFFMLSLANVMNIVTFVLAQPILRGFCVSFANAISVTMISRLMLNLRSPSLSPGNKAGNTEKTNTGYLEFFVTTIVDDGPFVDLPSPGASYTASILAPDEESEII